MSPGEKRRRKAKRERERVLHDGTIAALKKIGASCATCRHFAKAPFGLTGNICQHGSDFEGYMKTTADDLCTDYALKLAQTG